MQIFSDDILINILRYISIADIFNANFISKMIHAKIRHNMNEFIYDLAPNCDIGMWYDIEDRIFTDGSR